MSFLNADTLPSVGPGRKVNAQQGDLPWQLGIQLVSRSWIGLDVEVRRGDTPIR